MVRVITRQSFFSKYRGYILGATPIAILLIGVMVTFSLVTQESDIRSRATVPQGDLSMVFDDSLLPGWTDKSIDAKNTFSHTEPVFSGSSAIAFSNTKGFGSFHLSSEAPLTLPYWANLNFSLRAAYPNESYSVSILNVNAERIGEKVYLSNLGGNPQVGTWRTYSVTLSEFGIIEESIGGVLIQDESGIAGNTVYIDDINFSIPQENTIPQEN